MLSLMTLTEQTRAIQMLQISDEVFDNYAQPNSVYLRYHGFILESNHADCVDIAIVCPRQATARLRALYDMVYRISPMVVT